MRLSVVTPAGTLIERDVTEVYAPGAAGEIGVLTDHITFLGNMGTGEVRYKGPEGSGWLIMSGGVLEVMDNEVTILADRAMLPEHIDSDRARHDLVEASDVMEEADPLTAEYSHADTARRWAEIQIAKS